MDFENLHKIPNKQLLQQVIPYYKKGLTDEEVIEKRKQYGYNELDKEEPESIWKKIAEQFEDILVRILLISAVISFIASYYGKKDEHSLPPWIEPCVIFAILIANACVGIYQDYNADNAIQALKEMQSFSSHCLRNEKWQEIPSRELVPGDIIQIRTGDKIPADARLFELSTITLRTNQSALTGESSPNQKVVEEVNNDAAQILDKSNILFGGTTVSNGQGLAVVIQIGMKTEFGKIQKSIQEIEEKETPLKKKLDEFGNQLAKVIGIICLILWLMNFRNFSDPAYGNVIQGALHFFKLAVALAVAAIPEGLPAVITTCLALGTRKMAKQNAIIRKLNSVQTLGCTQIICSDKTGTLTTNESIFYIFILNGNLKVCVKHFFTLDNINKNIQIISHDVEGQSFDTKGEISNFQQVELFPPNIQQFLECCALCNESNILFDESKNKCKAIGLPTETALKVLCEKIGRYDHNPHHLSMLADIKQKNQMNQELYCTLLALQSKKLATLEFTRDRKKMSILLQSQLFPNKNIMYIKGAPDYILQNSLQYLDQKGQRQPFFDQEKKLIQQQILQYAKQGLRTLAIAIKTEVDQLAFYETDNNVKKLLENPLNYQQLESSPIFIGCVAMMDPPRKDVQKSIQKCNDAGISVLMITGDIKETANTIATNIGIITDVNEIQQRSFTGLEFNQKSQQEQNKIIQQVIQYPSGLVFSRTEPIHKMELISLFQQQNQIVAMTGDGVNDAPALAKADIGIAMGISGTEVAKEASDMVLADDNFNTIVNAVEQGRAIYENMKAFIRYMISSNIGEVVSIFLSSLLGIPDGFNSIQLLWVNLVTDGLPATALSFNPPDPDIMDKPPRNQDEPIITRWIFFRYLVIGTYVGLATVGIFIYWYLFYDWAGDGHELVKYSQLKDWSECQNWSTPFFVKNFGKYDFSDDSCNYFIWGKEKASTLSLTVLVIIEMFNALNAISEDNSLLKVGIFANPILLLAVLGSVILHFAILYIPFLSQMFSTVPLSLNDWILVIIVSFPVIIVDEFLKFLSRQRNIRIKQKLYGKIKQKD